MVAASQIPGDAAALLAVVAASSVYWVVRAPSEVYKLQKQARAVTDDAWDSVLEEGRPAPTVWAEAAAEAEEAAARSLEGRRRPRSREPAEVPERASTCVG